MTQAAQLLGDTIADYISAQAKHKKIIAPIALEVVFDRPELMDDFLEKTVILAPGLSKYDNRLIGFYEPEEARKIYSRLNDVLNAFDYSLIRQSFSKDWLSDYLKNNRFGVTYIVVSNDLTSPDMIFSEKRISARAPVIDYEKKVATAKRLAPDYSISAMTDDFVRFIDANWTGFAAANGARELVTGLVATLKNEIKDTLYIGCNAPVGGPLVYALLEKAEYLDEIRLGDDVGASMVIQKHYYAIKKTIKDLGKNRQDSYIAIYAPMEAFIAEHAPNIARRTGDFVPFAGIDLSYDNMFDINGALNFDNQQDEIPSFVRQPEIIASAFTSYCMGLLSIKCLVRCEALFVEHSKVMDEQPFYDNWLEIIKKASLSSQFDTETNPKVSSADNSQDTSSLGM